MRVVGFHFVGAHAFVFATVDEVLHLLGREFFIVHVHQFHQAFDDGQLVGNV